MSRVPVRAMRCVRALGPWALACCVLFVTASGHALAETEAVGGGRTARTHRIVMDGTRFAPEQLTVARGDRVVWVNQDPFPHTATASGAFDSGKLGIGQSWALDARTPGEFAYVCTLHPGMKGTLTVR